MGQRFLSPELIYEALLDDEALGRLPGLLAEAVGARSSTFHLVSPRGEVEMLSFTYFDPDYVAEYAASFAPLDPWANAGLAHPGRQNRAVILEELVSDAAYEASAFYNEFTRLRGDDTLRCLGCVMTGSFGASVLGLQRGRTQKGYEAADQAVLQAALPHIRRLLSVRETLASAKDATGVAVDGLSELAATAITVGRDGRVEISTPTAETFLCAAGGVSLRSGGLLFASRAAQARWDALVALATRTPEPQAGAMAVGRGAGAEPALWVEVTPLIGRPGGPKALAVFRMARIGAAELTRRLRGLYALSAAEAEVAISVSQGETVEQIAERRHKAVATVRTQVRAVLVKTQTARLVELAGLVGRLSR